MAQIALANKIVGDSCPSFLIAEVGQSHDGSLGSAHATLDAVADSGFDAVKFQMHIAREESTLDEPFRINFSPQDSTRYAYWKRISFDFLMWKELKSHAEDRGLMFLCTPFSLKAVEWLKRLDVSAWKIGSGDIEFGEMIDAICETDKPILASTGMASWSDTDRLVERLRRTTEQVGLMQCTSLYPTPLSKVGLNVIGEMKRRYDIVSGLSDHSGSSYPSWAAIAEGAEILEVHCCFDKRQFGPDTSSSLTFQELETIAGFRDALFTMRKNRVDKNTLSAEFEAQRSLFSRSIGLKRDLKAGSILTESDLALKKPAGGIPPSKWSSVVGRKLCRDVDSKRLLTEEDLQVD